MWPAWKQQLLPERSYEPRDMNTSHLINELKIFPNHTLPARFRVGKFIGYADVFKWPLDYSLRAIAETVGEFVMREAILTREAKVTLSPTGRRARAERKITPAILP